MHLLMIRHENNSSPAIMDEDHNLYDLCSFLKDHFSHGNPAPWFQPTLDTIFHAESPLELIADMRGSLKYLPVIEWKEWKPDVPLQNADLICVGRNYADHAKELGNPVPAEPVLFMKPRSSLIASKAEIHFSSDLDNVQYEGEIAFVIGKTLQGAISEEEADKAIVGMTLLNDITNRAKQGQLKEKGKPWLLGKGGSTFAPCGPKIYLREPTDSWSDFALTTMVNTEIRQEGNPDQWLWSANTLVRIIAEKLGLRAGDIISTGTPSGVGKLTDGDVVEVYSPKIGLLKNKVVCQ